MMKELTASATFILGFTLTILHKNLMIPGTLLTYATMIWLLKK